MTRPSAISRLILIVLTLALVCLLVSASVQAQDAAAWDVLNLLNAARNQAGIPSLVMNPQLVAAAQRHSSDMAAGDFLSHTGSDGSEFPARMNDAGYSMTAGAENILYRWDASGAGAFDQWLNSPPHFANMMNAQYVEVGIAQAQSASGKFYFTMVLGARPGVSAPQIVPTSTPFVPSPVPPSSTPIPPSPVPPSSTPLPPSPIPATSTPISPPTFTPVIIVPPSATPYIIIVTATAQPGLVMPPTNTPTPLPPPATIPLLPTAAANPQPANVFLSLLRGFMQVFSPARPAPPTVLPTFTPLPAPTLAPPTPTSIPPDVRLTYSWDGVTLLNISGHALDLSGLIFTSATGTMSVTRWNTEYLTQPLNNFSANDCLQVWGGDSAALAVPGDCHYRHAWIVVDRSAVFWRNVELFNVTKDGQTLAQCDTLYGVCEFSLSAAPLPISSEPLVTRPQADLRLVYSDDSLALINTSGHSLDLHGLVFRSAAGMMNVEQWENEYLSQPLNNFTPGDCLQVWGFGGDVRGKPGDCHTRHAWIAANDSGAFWRNTDRFTVSRLGIELAVCNVAHGSCEVSLSGQPTGQPTTDLQPAAPIAPVNLPVANAPASNGVDIRLVYGHDSFTLINVSGHDLDIRSLAFESDSGVLLATDWDSGSLSKPLGAFPSPDCLQAWGTGETMQEKPVECRFRHAWMAVRADLQIWRDVTSFRVRSGPNLLAACNVGAGVCEFSLP